MPRIVVIGAGASVEEGIRIGLPPERRLPLVRDFPQLWSRMFSPDAQQLNEASGRVQIR